MVTVTTRAPIQRNLIESVVVAVVLTGISYVVGVSMGWIDTVSWLEAFAVFTSYVCTYLCVVERRLNYPIGAISTAAYAWLFIQYDLLGSATLNIYLAFALIYGWFRWKSDKDTRPVTFVQAKWWPVYIAVTALGYLGALGIITLLGGSIVFTDTFILIGTILAQFLLDNKKLETWGVWLIVNVFAIYTYFTSGLYIAGFQYIFFALNTVYGFYMWNKSRIATKELVV